GVEAEDGDVERFAQLGLDALGARAVAGDLEAAADVAAARDALAVAAVVAGERVLGAVPDQRDVAVPALPPPPAVSAGEEVRPAAAVEEDDRLAGGGERAAGVRVQRVVGAAHVEHAHGREVAAAGDARGQAHAAGGVDGLGARRGAAGEQAGVGLVGAE